MIPQEDVRVGDRIVAAEYGPLTILETVRWAGVQENWDGVHWDRESVRENSQLRTFIASGTFRQALLVRALTDWLGSSGSLKKLAIRHVAPTYEGDMQRYSARVVEKSDDPEGCLVSCEVEGVNQNDERILVGSCVLKVRSAGKRP
jgi:acyl dehydratase